MNLEWAFGFRTIYKENVDDCRNMASLLSNGNVVFSTAGVGIVHNVIK